MSHCKENFKQVQLTSRYQSSLLFSLYLATLPKYAPVFHCFCQMRLQPQTDWSSVIGVVELSLQKTAQPVSRKIILFALKGKVQL